MTMNLPKDSSEPCSLKAAPQRKLQAHHIVVIAAVVLALVVALGSVGGSVDPRVRAQQAIVRLSAACGSQATKLASAENAPVPTGDLTTTEVTPFYIPPKASVFRQIAQSLKPVTDKVSGSNAPGSGHTYDALYSKYLEPEGRRFQRLKLLEIGLGCDMGYGPGASAAVWLKFLPNADVWFAEYDAACVEKHRSKLTAMGIKGIVTGDQADNTTLERWVQETGGGFDVIIDDGGHVNHQIFNSFATLFHNALKPGGIYFLEDLQVSRFAGYRGPPGTPVMAAVIMDWVQSLMATSRFASPQDLANPAVMQASADTYKREQQNNNHTGDSAYLATWKLPRGAKMVDCAAEMCAVIKCTEDDTLCPDGMAKEL